jgi:hypothetical protein
MAIQFLNNVNADSGVLYVDAVNNKVGIGTTSPATNLEIKSTGNTIVRLSTDGDAADQQILQFYRNSGAYAQIDYDPGGGNSSGLSLTDFRDDINSHILFNTRGTNERMRIESDGNVGIGTTSPSAKLHVNGQTGLIVGDGSETGLSINNGTYIYKIGDISGHIYTK